MPAAHFRARPRIGTYRVLFCRSWAFQGEKYAPRARRSIFPTPTMLFPVVSGRLSGAENAVPWLREHASGVEKVPPGPRRTSFPASECTYRVLPGDPPGPKNTSSRPGERHFCRGNFFPGGPGSDLRHAKAFPPARGTTFSSAESPSLGPVGDSSALEEILPGSGEDHPEGFSLDPSPDTPSRSGSSKAAPAPAGSRSGGRMVPPGPVSWHVRRDQVPTCCSGRPRRRRPRSPRPVTS